MNLEGWQADLIAALRVARLGTVATDGRPHLVPVCYALSEGRFAIAIDEKPKHPGLLQRLRNLERDPRCTLLFDHYEDDWTRLAWVRVDARAAVLAEGRAAPAALAALRERYPQYRAMDLESRPLILLEAERVVGWRWDDATA